MIDKPLSKLIIAVDFDGTCVTHEFPDVGREIGSPPVLLWLVENGARLILWTMRSDGRDDGSNPLSDAVNWFEKHKIPLFGINENPEQRKWTGSPKAYANLYIDDAALGIPLITPNNKEERPYVDWDIVKRQVEFQFVNGGNLNKEELKKIVDFVDSSVGTTEQEYDPFYKRTKLLCAIVRETLL